MLARKVRLLIAYDRPLQPAVSSSGRAHSPDGCRPALVSRAKPRQLPFKEQAPDIPSRTNKKRQHACYGCGRNDPLTCPTSHHDRAEKTPSKSVNSRSKEPDGPSAEERPRADGPGPTPAMAPDCLEHTSTLPNSPRIPGPIQRDVRRRFTRKAPTKTGSYRQTIQSQAGLRPARMPNPERDRLPRSAFPSVVRRIEYPKSEGFLLGLVWPTSRRMD